MQKKKNISLLISFVVLTLLCFVVYWFGHSNTTLQIDDNLFRVDDFKSIDRIVLSSSNQKIELEYFDNRWRVNDQYIADRNLVDILFATFQQAVPKRPIAERMHDSVSLELDKSGVHVSLFAGTELKKEFVAGGNAGKTQAYFKQISQSTPYLMVIPGYRVYVSGILELDERGWRDKYVFGFNWQNFKKLEAKFPGSPKNDFNIIMQDRAPVLDGIVKVDTARLNTFLDDVSVLTVDAFVANADILKNGDPIMKIRIEDIAGRSYSVDFFSMRPNSDQFPALIQGTDPALFDGRKLERILKPREFFELK